MYGTRLFLVVPSNRARSSGKEDTEAQKVSPGYEEELLYCAGD